jgi:S-adenosyl-L-methionine hydrolase (adenosine-forming)
MALITFMSDFGTSDHFVAAVKAKILSVNPGLRIIDISHSIEHFNIPHAAFVLKSVFQEFPKGTVHLVGVDSINHKEDEYLAVKLDEHFFLGVNNGLFSLISNTEPNAIIRLNLPANKKTTFPAKDIFAAAAARLASGASIYDLGIPTKNFKRMLPRQVKATKKQMVGNVIRVDHYGNLITNIERELFYSLKGNNDFSVSFGIERVHKIHENYSDAEPGDCFVIFNSQGFMEIGINNGNASELLGLGYDSTVSVGFIENAYAPDIFALEAQAEERRSEELAAARYEEEEETVEYAEDDNDNEVFLNAGYDELELESDSHTEMMVEPEDEFLADEDMTDSELEPENAEDLFVSYRFESPVAESTVSEEEDSDEKDLNL